MYGLKKFGARKSHFSDAKGIVTKEYATILRVFPEYSVVEWTVLSVITKLNYQYIILISTVTVTLQQ